jgi:nucleoside phosphorylase
MINILIVEDNLDKLREIVAQLLLVDGISEDNIHEAMDVASAKKKLKAKKFTLLILDMNLPINKGRFAEKLTGLEVLNFIRNNRKAISPDHIIGTTAYADVYKEAQKEFASLIWQVIEFSFTNEDWKLQLNSTLKYLVANDNPPYKNDGKTHHIEVGIVCALQEELDAILNLDLDWKIVDILYDHSRYYRASIKLEDSLIELVAVASPKMGMSPSAVVSQKLISHFRPKMLVMTGICAGIRDKTDIGDILIADPCFEWGGGKWVSDDAGKLTLKTAPYPWRIHDSIREAILDVKSEPKLLGDIYSSYIGKRPENIPKVIIEAMASGSSVLQSSEMLSEIVKQHKNLVGVEMESYSVFTAAEYSESPQPLCVTLKSVCDFGDETKADGYHQYACHTSAQFFYSFVKKWFDTNY